MERMVGMSQAERMPEVRATVLTKLLKYEESRGGKSHRGMNFGNVNLRYDQRLGVVPSKQEVRHRGVRAGCGA